MFRVNSTENTGKGMRAKDFITELQKPTEITDFRNQFNDMYSPQRDEWDDKYEQSQVFDQMRGEVFGNHTSMKKSTLDEMMAGYDFHPIGTGGFGSVYQNLKYPYVLKVYVDTGGDNGYKKWIQWCKKNQDNPFVPKIKGKTVRIINDVHAVRLELLRPISNEKVYEEIRRFFNKWENNMEEQKEQIRKQNPELGEVLDVLAAAPPAIIDLKMGNFMERQNGHPVIVDPLAG